MKSLDIRKIGLDVLLPSKGGLKSEGGVLTEPHVRFLFVNFAPNETRF
jgi:hypothetical protein